ncbi:MAG TPA: hypothetical protein VMW42_01410 [Desulfatiglandales bacterium]|nr:hypothetical protein [Desulfatiglandales bacterium]
MIIKISNDESIVLANIIFDNILKGYSKTNDLYLHLENGHLYIMPNGRGILKIKRFNHIKGKSFKEAREVSLKKKAIEYEGICIDLNLQKDINKEKVEINKEKK